ncbi:EamA family transporter [Miniimonas arenae]|uniref:EamA family transporter n=2 Tax=Miniimonas arenae TaxID=676201 RepID=A0A5C5BAC6_9MICO|nr:EamA family transporter [Miniimonas arenae]
MYYGAALAVGLFATASAVSVGWARLVVAAVVLVALARPWQLTWTRRSLGVAALFGILLGGMNLLFYVAIDHLPLGAAVAIEFTGPVAVAVASDRSPWSAQRLLAPLLAAGGVAVISLGEVDWAHLGSGSAVGVLFALAAGAAWAGYMVVGRRIAARAGEVASVEPDTGAVVGLDVADGGAPVGDHTGDGDHAGDRETGGEVRARGGRPVGALRRGMASLALGMVTAAVGYAVVGLPDAAPLVTDAHTVALVLGVAVLSSVVPYALDQVAMKRLSTSVFALLNALLPATATLVGFLSLRQLPSVGELLGVVAISAAVALATRPHADA